MYFHIHNQLFRGVLNDGIMLFMQELKLKKQLISHCELSLTFNLHYFIFRAGFIPRRRQNTPSASQNEGGFKA